jgi:hypothetical protein
MPTLAPEQILELICTLDSKLRVRLFFAAWRGEQWWGTTKELTTRARVPHRRGEIELARLVSEEFLVRHEKGPQNQGRLVRFEAGAAAIKLIGALRSKRSERHDRFDRSATIETIAPLRSQRSLPIDDAGARACAPDPDLSLDPGSMEQRVCPSGGVLGEATADGPTDDGERLASHQNALTERVCREWARWAVTPAVAYNGIQRLLNARLTERELQKFLVDALNGKHPAFHGVEEHVRWGHSTSAKRIALWLQIERTASELQQRPAPTRARREPEAQISRAEYQARLERAQRAARGRP